MESDGYSDMDYSSENKDNDAEWMFCLGLLSEDTSGEKWIRCYQYLKWSDEACSNSDKNKNFVCDFYLSG
ncbi:unnamed protein product [Acanthoscelides obtectus]|uniref:Uncharacterized protein n=1 Tax=Acanthoscelides obtectus TaxID=200917 RepID=A0A9P0P2Q9_ACAOB|nr:unnamed protein product [Acanthoscelides obtectus]CAK1666552.1 hypothetical protein AOBTE_LOCUS25369 [Acanthoscelides obtectus]